LLVVVDVCADFVEETGVVGNDQAGNLGVGLEVLSEPGDVGNIQMVGRFVEKKHVGAHKHSTRQSELHLPSTGKRADLVGLPAFGTGGEADLLENLFDTLPALVGKARVANDVLENGKIGVFSLVVLDEAGLDLILRRETFQLAACDTSHECRLSSTVTAAKTITVALE
jgi:hypothetical protein